MKFVPKQQTEGTFRDLAKEEMVSKETQVEAGFDSKCIECNFQATSNSEFSWHMEENHGWSHDQSQEDLDSSEGVRCDYEA